MIVVGIVGSPAGGKSTVAERLQELGATWINADLIARSVLEHDEVRRRLIDRFGIEIVDNDGKIDRSRLAALVFGADDSKRAGLNYLESLVHPRTRQLIQNRLHDAATQKVAVTILDVPLLFESKWDLACDQVWCVDAPVERRLQWAAIRGWDAAELERREANQLSIDEKRRLSTLVLTNHESLQSLLDRVDRQFEILIQSPADHTTHCV